MTSSITATPDAGNSPPRIELTLVGATGTTVTIQRSDPTGRQAAIRSANPGALASGGWIGYDYEAPYNEAVTYVATSDTGASSSVTVPALREFGAQQGWLIHPGIPDLSVPLDGPLLGDETRDLTQGVNAVVGRAEPIVVTDGARKAPAFQLTTKARTKAADDAMQALLADGSVLLLQYVFPFTDLYDYYWVAVGQATRARVTSDYSEPYYLWTLPCAVAAAPSGLLQAQWSYADVLADYAAYADINSAFESYADLVVNHPAGS